MGENPYGIDTNVKKKNPLEMCFQTPLYVDALTNNTNISLKGHLGLPWEDYQRSDR